jgi:protein arginine kinase activator
MLCQICKMNEATIRYTEIINNSVTEVHLCEACAQFDDKTASEDFPLQGLFAMQDQTETSAVTETEAAQECSSCGVTFGDVVAHGRLGCAECYTVFADKLEPLIEKVHGASQHIGKIPRAKGEGSRARSELLRYRSQLRKAIESENYEEAARLRDLIRGIEQRMVEP